MDVLPLYLNSEPDSIRNLPAGAPDFHCYFLMIFAVVFYVDAENPVYGLTVKTPDGVTICGENSRDCIGGHQPHPVRKGKRVQVCFSIDQVFCSADYLLSVGVVDDRDGELVPLDRRNDAIFLHSNNDKDSHGLVDLGIRVEVT